jgi:hypothetical protein
MSDWDKIDLRIQKEILWKEHEEKAKQQRARTAHRQESTFEVVVDGTVQDVFNRREGSVRKISLPAAARYVEIRDRGSRATVANCHLMDPHDLPQKGWQNAVKLFSGEKVRFTFFPEPGSDEQGTGLSMRVNVNASPWQSLARGAELLVERGRLVEPYRIPAFSIVTILLALVLLGAGFTITTLLEQFDELVKRLHLDKPLIVRPLAVGQRSLQLDISFPPTIVRKIFVDFGDPDQPDPAPRGTQLDLSAGLQVERGKLLLPPITHEYGAVPPEGRRTKVCVYVETVPLKVFPEWLMEAQRNPCRDIWILPYGIILDPPKEQLSLVVPKEGEVISSTTEVQIQAGALTADIHLLASDPTHPTVYYHLGSLPPPSPGHTLQLTRIVETSQLGASGPFQLVVLSTNQLEPTADRTVEWHTIPHTAPRAQVNVRHAGRILFPTPNMVVSGVGMVRTQIFLSNTYAAAAIVPTQEGSCWVQNDGHRVTPFAEFPLQVSYGGRDTYQVYVGVTYDPALFKAGDRQPQCPHRDPQGRPVYWIGPVEVAHE